MMNKLSVRQTLNGVTLQIRTKRPAKNRKMERCIRSERMAVRITR